MVLILCVNRLPVSSVSERGVPQEIDPGKGLKILCESRGQNHNSYLLSFSDNSDSDFQPPGDSHTMRFIVTVLAALAAAVLPAVMGQAVNCQLVVPPRPLTAAGLATPYGLQFNATTAGNCLANNVNSIAFVHGVILDTTTGAVSVYNPLVVQAGTPAAIQPIQPTLPANNVVALWFGNNGNILTLVNTPGTNSTADGNCVNGVTINGALDTFVQYAYCNAPAFYQAAQNLILAGKMVVPPLGLATDGKTCPNVRAWDAIDQDQSDNVPTFYILDAATQSTAQFSTANMNALNQPTVLKNPSDNILITAFMMPAVGCATSVWNVPDLANPGGTSTALPLNEIQASYFALKPQALVPLTHAFAVVGAGNCPNVQLPTTLIPKKVNAYRAGVFQPNMFDPTNPTNTAGGGTALTSLGQINGQANPQQYCLKMNLIGGPRLQNFKAQYAAVTGPAPPQSLFAFLQARFATSNTNLACAFYAPNNVFVVQ
eukprot:TRINITY_DN1208_c0_g1_i1.p1 TRINITY_DN1208_c0_g1~~TRINITY_DN1208_c0_g1_i1.p1  ORF type:complete len:486 (+),score=122.25 TRINITY_DN1208_c0_g1_i1:2-1459(+)